MKQLSERTCSSVRCKGARSLEDEVAKVGNRAALPPALRFVCREVRRVFEYNISAGGHAHATAIGRDAGTVRQHFVSRKNSSVLEVHLYTEKHTRVIRNMIYTLYEVFMV